MRELDCDIVPLTEEPVEGGGVIDGENVLVPEGEYELRYVDYETANYFGDPRVTVHFAIIEPEDYAGLPIDRYYNVKKLTGPPRRFGKYIARRRGDLPREFNRIAGKSERLDRISFARFRDKRIIGDVCTVHRDHKKEPLPEEDQYSRIARLVRVLPGDDW